MAHQHHDLAIRLAERAEAVCRHYLSNGRRSGRYWIVGDARNSSGRSLYVRLTGPQSGKNAAGKWTDAATGEHGDLLDIIREASNLIDFRDVLDEAKGFLSLAAIKTATFADIKSDPVPSGSPQASRRLFSMSRPITGTLAETYLRQRGITALHETAALRFHPNCYHVPENGGPRAALPAMIAAVTGLDGRQWGAHRTWIASDGEGKAPLATPRKAMGELHGHAVRFGKPSSIMAVGEGIETVLSLRCLLPTMPMAAALSGAHLAAIRFPPTLRRLYIICDDDCAGEAARDRLMARAHTAGVEPIALSPVTSDFNDDLCRLGLKALAATLADQLPGDDRIRFLRKLS